MSLSNVAARALLANQVALHTTGHNIANANTAGYSRQSAVIKTAPGRDSAAGRIGTGAHIQTIVRQYDELLSRQAASAAAVSAGDTARALALAKMQEVFAAGDGSLGESINSVLNAFGDIAQAPGDLSVRTVVLSRMQELAARFRKAGTQLDDLAAGARAQMQATAERVNSLAAQVAALNGQISRSQASGHAPNDLLDARAQLVREISQCVQVTQSSAEDGSLNLLLAGSQPLVLGTQSAQLQLRESAQFPGSGQMALWLHPPGRGSRDVPLAASMLGGGDLAALLQFHNSDLAQARNLLGRMAAALGAALNARNQSGLTLGGQRGGALFTVPESVRGHSAIAGVQARVHFVDPGAGTAPKTALDCTAYVPSDYQVIFREGGALTLLRLCDNHASEFSSVAELAATTVDGLRFDISQAGAKNQRVLFQPFADAARSMQALINAPADLAAASPITAAMAQGNKGNLQLQALNLLHPHAKLPAAAGVDIRFQVDAQGVMTYTVAGAASGNGALQPYVPGQAIEIDGWSITLSGTPHDGDALRVGNALDAEYGDSYQRNAGNAAAFAALRDMRLFDQGSTLGDGFADVLARVGSQVQGAAYAAQLSAAMADHLEASRSAVSGVNLDEETARLLQLQQAYQASAKLLQVAQNLFDSVLQTTR